MYEIASLMCLKAGVKRQKSLWESKQYQDCLLDVTWFISCTVFSYYLSRPRMPKSKELVSSSSSASDSDSEVDKKVKIISSSLWLY